MLIVTKIVHWSQRKIKIFNKLVDEQLEEITKLDKKINLNLIHTYKGSITDTKFNKFGNAFSILYIEKVAK